MKNYRLLERTRSWLQRDCPRCQKPHPRGRSSVEAKVLCTPGGVNSRIEPPPFCVVPLIEANRSTVAGSLMIACAAATSAKEASAKGMRRSRVVVLILVDSFIGFYFLCRRLVWIAETILQKAAKKTKLLISAEYIRPQLCYFFFSFRNASFASCAYSPFGSSFKASSKYSRAAA